MSRLAQVTLVLVFFALVAAGPASLPAGVSYVVSDSMEPTIQEGDGVIRVPAGDVEPGDVVVFEQTEGDTAHTIHRVVAETPRGFVTKGDGNRATDQAAGDPYVQRSQIRGTVLTVGGEPVTIPHLGTLVAHRGLVLVAAVALALVDLAASSGGDRPDRPRTGGEVVRLMVAVAAIVAVCTIVIGGSTAQVSVAAADGRVPSVTTPADESATETIVVEGVTRSRMTHVTVDADSLTVTDRTWRDSALSLSVVPSQDLGTAHERDSGTTREAVVRVHTYPMTLPPGVIDALHSVHPLVAAGATTVGLVLPVYVLGLIFVGRHRYVRSGRSSLARSARLWRQRFGR